MHQEFDPNTWHILKGDECFPRLDFLLTSISEERVIK